MKIIVSAQLVEPGGGITMKTFTRIIKDCGPPLMVQWDFLRIYGSSNVLVPWVSTSGKSFSPGNLYGQAIKGD